LTVEPNTSNYLVGIWERGRGVIWSLLVWPGARADDGVAVGWLLSHLVVSNWAGFISAFSNMKWRMSVCFSPGFSNGDGRTGDDEADRGGDWGEDSDKMFERGGRQTTQGWACLHVLYDFNDIVFFPWFSVELTIMPYIICLLNV
jgi:hypothetical protein